MSIKFIKLNEGWNADPNDPLPVVQVQGADLHLRFFLNHHQYEQFQEGDFGVLTFRNCWRYRLGPTNDEGWYRGQCRFSKTAPAWGEFYEIEGPQPPEAIPLQWHVTAPAAPATRHFLFYFRDGTFECDALDWSLQVDHGEVA